MNYTNKRKRGKGFTLIELMIVIAIIAILAAVAIPSFLNARDRARRAAAVSVLGTLKKALEMYSSDKDTYPFVPASFPGDITTSRDRLVGEIGGYIGVTGVIRDVRAIGGTGACDVGTENCAMFSFRSADTYSITVIARDRRSVLCTATPMGACCWDPGDPTACNIGDEF